MDDRNGTIWTHEQVQAMPEEERRHMMPMRLPATIQQKIRGRVSRNEPCPCASGKKFKHCCLAKAERRK